MNKYETQFYCDCPSNGVRILYRLQIVTSDVIPVEQLIAKIETYSEEFHETIADELNAAFGGTQTLTADHHSVTITTTRD